MCACACVRVRVSMRARACESGVDNRQQLVSELVYIKEDTAVSSLL